MSIWPKRTGESQDWSQYLSTAPSSKRRLIEECIRQKVVIFADDQTENAEGIYANFRPVASEAELQRRLLSKNADSKATWANVISALAFVISVVALVKSF